ncbi:MAG: response regulator transcription factor, partial [Chloroflexota bacterium]|nr:response regulator transcription factor [Chloroflexota bacterium]
MHLLVVEDDLRLARALSRLLTEDRHVVDVAHTGSDGLDLILGDVGIEAVILDIRLPDIDGLEVCRRLRDFGSALPILMLTARDAVSDRVAGLDAGADDYLVKPFAYAELTARLRALVRRHEARTAGTGQQLCVGGITLDEASRCVTVDGTGVDLSRREFALLECLLRHPDQVLSRSQMLDHAWPISVAVTPNSVDAYVSFLRRKLGSEADRLQTVRGVGY